MKDILLLASLLAVAISASACASARSTPAAARPPTEHRTFDAACAAGDAAACYTIGISARGAADTDTKRSVDSLRRACELGEPLGCSALSVALQRSNATLSATDEARGFLKKACDGGDAHACTALGSFVTQTPALAGRAPALNLFAIACKGGSSLGCFELAKLHAQDHGLTDTGPFATIPLYEKACAGGTAEACYALALIHAAGELPSSDRTKAHDLMIAACTAGHGDACSRPELAAPDSVPSESAASNSLRSRSVGAAAPSKKTK